MTLPLTVIGGYLGAGKTTLLNRMLTGDHGQRIAVIVNDFGALNIDASLIAEHSGETVSLTNGCVCCSASDGISESVAWIVAQGDAFDHIVIECSGVAMPGKVARLASAFRLPLDGVIVLVDAEQLPDQSVNKYTGRAVKEQLTQADLLVLNKTDLVDETRLEESRAIIRANVSDIPCVETTRADLPLTLLFGARAERDDVPEHAVSGDETEHATAYRSDLWECSDPISRIEFERLAKQFASGALRAKGHIALAEAPDVRHLYQQVGRRWTLTPDGQWIDGERQSRIVSIGLACPASSLVGQNGVIE